ncbi:MAG TPA: regulatory protein RecX [Verrucomicrobiae bacterium]|nr:regulatory protein RecX [Verrucomicrobiae bacterium]
MSDVSTPCREAALKLLERTRRTRRDLERRLKEKDFDAATIAATLDRLAEVGLIDDVEFARAWLAGRWGRKPSGWRRLVQELRAKGISEEDAERARELLSERGSAPDEVGSAAKLVAQARKRYARLEPQAQRQRLYALLARRGYDSDVIRRALELKEPLESGAEG